VNSGPLIRALAIVICLTWSRLLYYFLVQINLSSPPAGIFAIIGQYQPLINSQIMPPVPVNKSLWNYEQPELTSLQKQALFLALQMTVLKMLCSSVERIVPLDSCTTISGVDICGIQAAVQRAGLNPLTTISAWISLMLGFSVQLGLMMAKGNLAISALWFFGFKLPLLAEAPHRARDCLDFFARINRYAKDLFFIFGFYPIFLRLRRWPISLRVFLSLLGSVGLINFCFTAVTRIAFLFSAGTEAFFNQLLSYTVYCLALTVLLFGPTLRSLGEKTSKDRSQAITLAIIVIGFALISIFDCYFLGAPLERFYFLVGLFGLYGL